MLMMLYALGPAFADPPALPVWRDDDDKDLDDPDPFRGDRDLDNGLPETEVYNGVREPVVLCNSDDPQPTYTWSDPREAVVALPGLQTGAIGRTAWLRLTARVGGDVFMWLQGPYVDDGVTLIQSVSMDSRAIEAARTSDRPGELTAAVIVQGS